MKKTKKFKHQTASFQVTGIEINTSPKLVLVKIKLQYVTLYYCSVQNAFAMVFLPIKINYHDQNFEIWRHNVECHGLIFACNV